MSWRRGWCAPPARCSRRRRQAGEHLLAVDDVVVAVVDRGGPQGGQVGAGAGLGVADGEVQFAAQILGRKNFFCSSVPNAMMVGATVLIVRNGTGTPAMHLVGEDERVQRGAVLTAVFFGPVRASQPSLPICWTVSRYALPVPTSPCVELSASRRSGVISVVKYDRSSRRSSSCSAGAVDAHSSRPWLMSHAVARPTATVRLPG